MPVRDSRPLLVVFLIASLFIPTAGFGLNIDSKSAKANLTSMIGLRGFDDTGYLTSFCTIFTITIGDTVFYGNNEDIGIDNTYVWFVPSQEMWTPSGTITIHGSFFLGVDNTDSDLDGWPQGGMNDQGLCLDANSLPRLALTPHPEREPQYTSCLYEILWECVTVTDAIAWFESHNLGPSMACQIHIADATGDAVVVSVGPGSEFAYTRRGSASYLISTNFNLVNYSNGYYPCWRYSRARGMLKDITSEANLTVTACRDVLDAVHSSVTSYSNVFDLVNGEIYLYQNHNFSEVIQLNLDAELEQVVPGAPGVDQEKGFFAKTIRIADLFDPPENSTIGQFLLQIGLVAGVTGVAILIILYVSRKLRQPKI